MPDTYTGWTLLAGALALLVVVAVVVVRLGRLDVEPEPILPAPLPDAVRAWLVSDARVRHDGLGTVLDGTPTHSPGGDGLYVLVRFDTLSGPRWIRPRELDPVTPRDEEHLRRIEERRPRLRSVDGVERGVWPRSCGPDASCYWHGDGCGRASTWTREVAYCCGGCPARSGGVS